MAVPNDPEFKPAGVVVGAQDDLNLDASIAAPILYFDGASNFGLNNGVANVTLEANRFLSVSGKVVRDRVVVAHLRMSFPAAMSLRAALNNLALLAAPQGDRPTN